MWPNSCNKNASPGNTTGRLCCSLQKMFPHQQRNENTVSVFFCFVLFAVNGLWLVVMLIFARTEQQRRWTKRLRRGCSEPERIFEGSFEAAALLLVALITTDSEWSASSCVPTTTPPSPTHLHSHTCTRAVPHNQTRLIVQTYYYHFIILFRENAKVHHRLFDSCISARGNNEACRVLIFQP